MRALMPLAVLALAACDPPLEEVFPARFYSFEQDGIVYEARAQFDPFEHGWFLRVTSIEVPMEADDLDLAVSLAENAVGPLVCDGDALDVEPGGVWNPLAGGQVEFLEYLDTFQLVGRCTDQPPVPGVATVSFEPDVMITVDED
jgi:hypothetical protein